MNAPLEVTDVQVDLRRVFLLIAAVHHDHVERGDETLDEAFRSVTSWLDRMFPPEAECCETCGLAPCGNPSFCATCRRNDERLGGSV